jgi:preprotein translocase subunit Sec61beta
MAKKEKNYIPLGIGGLVRYREEEESRIKITPKQLIYLLAAIGSFMLLLRFLLH